MKWKGLMVVLKERLLFGFLLTGVLTVHKTLYCNLVITLYVNTNKSKGSLFHSELSWFPPFMEHLYLWTLGTVAFSFLSPAFLFVCQFFCLVFESKISLEDGRWVDSSPHPFHAAPLLPRECNPSWCTTSAWCLDHLKIAACCWRSPWDHCGWYHPNTPEMSVCLSSLKIVNERVYTHVSITWKMKDDTWYEKLKVDTY